MPRVLSRGPYHDEGSSAPHAASTVRVSSGAVTAPVAVHLSRLDTSEITHPDFRNLDVVLDSGGGLPITVAQMQAILYTSTKIYPPALLH